MRIARGDVSSNVLRAREGDRPLLSWMRIGFAKK